MPTVKVALDQTQYVQVNNTLNSVVLQSLRDTVRIVLNDTQPATSNTVYHELGGKDSPLHIESPDTNIWALAMTDRSALIVSELSPAKSAAHDGNGNPLSAYYHSATDEYVLNIHNADVHGIPVNIPFHQHTGVSSTLAVAVAADGGDRTITVVNATSFNIGDHVQIGGDANNTGYKPKILNIAGQNITLDTLIDYGWPIGTTVEVVEVDMNVAGSLATPEEFIIRPNAGQVIHITRFLIEMTDATNGDLGDFGGLAALANGVLLRVRLGTQYGTFTNWKTNADIKLDMYDFDFDTRAGGGGTYGFTARGSLNKIGVAARLDADNDDIMEVYIQDDLTGLLSFRIKAQGHVEGA